jgi:hypothetical protein
MFYTIVNIEQFDKKINYDDKLFFIGSCFSNEIAQKFSLYKFNVLVNPFGTLYNPVSIYQSIERIIDKKFVNENDFFLDEDIYKSYDFHSTLAGIKIDELTKQVNEIINKSYFFLKDVSWIFITYGTSYVYEHKQLKKIVANCHKKPSNEFINRMLNFNETYEYIEKTVSLIKNFNSRTNIVFTISPVRYLKYGAFENQVSKSVLFIALNKLRKNYPETNYFPSYEIFIDELRDYRYYAADLLHPSDIGIEYVWNRLIDTTFDNNTKTLYKEIQNIINSCKHRPMFRESKTYDLFKNNLLSKIESLEKRYSFLDFEKEKLQLK